MKIPVNKTGYLKGAKTAKNPVNIIPSSLITTQGMAFPIKANGKTLYPNTGQYKFPTSYVVETPLKQQGSNKVEAGPVLKDAVKKYSKPMPAPKKKQLEDNDSWLENAVEIVDPLGVTSYDDVYRSYKNTGLSGETALEALGAIPLIGKIGKGGKVIAGGIGLLHKLAPKVKYLPEKIQQKAIDNLFKGYQTYAKYGGNKVDDFLGTTTKKFMDNVSYVNPDSQKYIPAARNAFNYLQTAGKVKDAVSTALGSKDDSGFKYKNDKFKFNGRNIFPEIFQKGTKSTKAQPKPSWFNTPIEFGKEPGSIGRYIGKALTLGAEPVKGKGYSITPSKTIKNTIEDYVTGEVGGAVLKRAMPYVKPYLKTATKPLIDKAAPVVNKVTSSIKNAPTYLNNAIGGAANLVDEGVGRMFKNKGNKQAIAEGNQWLENWIKHPKTQAKIDADMDAALAARNKVFDYEIGLMRRQSKNYKPSVKEYPLKQQVKDIVKGEKHIHSDNSGVSYTHRHDPYWRDVIEQGQYKPNSRYGEWISRDPFISQKNRASTTIHEGTHGWVSADALKTSGMRNRVLKEMPADSKKDLLEWESLRKKGIDPETVMGKEKAYNAYISNPTEMHARVMEVRKHFGLTPDDVIDEDRARNMMIKIMEMPSRKRPVDIHTMSKTLGDSPKALANLMNKMWAVPAVGAAGVAAQQKKNGAKLIKYKNGSKSVSLAFSRGEKDPKGGLTQKGVDKYNRATGGNLKMAVTTPPSKLKAGSKAANRRKSFCARMSGVKGPMRKPNGEPSRKALALRKWNC